MIASSRERRRSLCPVSRRSFGRIVPSDATKESRPAIRGKPKKQNCKLPRYQAPKAGNLKSRPARKIDSHSAAWEIFHGRLGIIDAYSTLGFVSLDSPPWLAKVSATAIGLVLNFTARRFIVFPEAPRPDWKPQDPK